MDTSSNFDFLAVGDVFNDTFIELEEAKVTCDANNENCIISMAFGDKLPYKQATLVRGVGNAGNAAVSAARLGLSSAILTITGEDEDGKKIAESYAQEKISPLFLKTDPTFPTNNAYVLMYGPERTILVKQEAFPFAVPVETFAAHKPKWIYLTSIGKAEVAFQHDLIKWLEENKDVKLVFQPGTFQLQAGKDELADIYKRSDIFFCNVEEAKIILGDGKTEIKDLLLGIHLLGPQAVVITDGPKGAYGADKTGIYFAPPFNPEEEAFERTGAGDAFASATTSAIALGKTLPEALAWGAINGMSVCRYIGAQKGLLTQDGIQAELAKKPDYKVSTI